MSFDLSSAHRQQLATAMPALSSAAGAAAVWLAHQPVHGSMALRPMLHAPLPHCLPPALQLLLILLLLLSLLLLFLLLQGASWSAFSAGSTHASYTYLTIARYWDT